MSFSISGSHRSCALEGRIRHESKACCPENGGRTRFCREGCPDPMSAHNLPMGSEAVQRCRLGMHGRIAMPSLDSRWGRPVRHPPSPRRECVGGTSLRKGQRDRAAARLGLGIPSGAHQQLIALIPQVASGTFDVADGTVHIRGAAHRDTWVCPGAAADRVTTGGVHLQCHRTLRGVGGKDARAAVNAAILVLGIDGSLRTGEPTLRDAVAGTSGASVCLGSVGRRLWGIGGATGQTEDDCHDPDSGDMHRLDAPTPGIWSPVRCPGGVSAAAGARSVRSRFAGRPGVGASARGAGVGPRSAVQRVVPEATVQLVVAVVPEQLVGVGVPRQDVVSIPATHDVVAGAARHVVPTPSALQGVGTIAANHDLSVGSTNQSVVAVLSEQLIYPRSSEQAIVAGSTIVVIVPRAA